MYYKSFGTLTSVVDFVQLKACVLIIEGVLVFGQYHVYFCSQKYGRIVTNSEALQ